MSVAEKLANYVDSLGYNDLDEKVVHEAKRRIIDTIACAIGAYNSTPVKTVRKDAILTTSKKSATILGTKNKTSPQLASFVNTTMSRYLDFMDTYFYNGEIVHPEDNICSILAVAESEKRNGKDVLLATVLAYEICCRLVDFANIRRRGWDHVIWITISTAAAISKILELPDKKTAEAISIAMSSNIPLRQIRVGGLSMWKGLAVAYSAMAGTFAANLARLGITGPKEVFEGKHGFFNQVTGKADLSIDNFCKSGDKFKILEVHIKNYPSEINSQSAIEAALEVRKRIKKIDDIKEINVETFTTAYEIIADQSKWNPTNRETADHSLPYIVCAALIDGEITEKQFSSKRISDSKLRDLMQRTNVSPSEECDADYYPGMPNIVEVVMKSGEKYSSKVVHYRGSYRNPMSDEELEAKFKILTKKFLTEKQIDKSLQFIWNMEKQKDLSSLFSNLVVRR